jgi:hypothetical protein
VRYDALDQLSRVEPPGRQRFEAVKEEVARLRDAVVFPGLSYAPRYYLIDVEIARDLKWSQHS